MELKIPPLPDTLGEILQVMSDESSDSIRRLAHIIRRDPATSIFVLRRINAPYNGVRRYISQVDQAIVLLGFKHVCNLVLAETIKKTFAYLESTAARNVYEHIIQTSLASAAFARELALFMRFPSAETAFTAGLLHQLGRLVLLQSASQLYASLWYEQVPGTTQYLFTAPSPEKEQSVFQTDYPHLGATIMRKWAFPEELVTVTYALHTPSRVVNGYMRTMTLIVATASAVAEDLFEATEDDTAAPSEIPVTLIALARANNLDERILADFLKEKSEAIRTFAEKIFNEA